jgi:hypothetical protein
MLAGATGGSCGDMLMHSLDTVKTRQQGDPTFPPKYTSMTSSYATIYRQEGFLRGLYGGAVPAFFGSFPGTLIFFGVYEFTKRQMIDSGINPNLAYLSGGKSVSNHVGLRNALIKAFRFLCGFGRFHRLCSFRSLEDATAAPGTLQQPSLQLWI